MDYDLHISFMGEDMGITPIRLDQSGQYELCDACYALFDAVGDVGHDEFMTRIFQALHGTGDYGAMNPDAVTSGAFEGLTWHIEETIES